MREYIKQQFEWAKLLFADDDERKLHPNAPTMKNLMLFALTVMFCIAFMKVVYLMEISVRTDLRIDNKTLSSDNSKYTFQIPDIPEGWRMVFMAGLGIMAALSGAKKVAELKYTNGNGKDISKTDKEQPKE